MSTTPPQQTTGEGGAGGGGGGGGYGAGGFTVGSTGGLARLPLPGNAEFTVFFLIWVFLLILWLASDRVETDHIATLTTALTFGYLISRGIAKASRVLEQ